MPTKRAQPRTTISVRLRPEVATALYMYGTIHEMYVYQVIEELVEKGLEASGTSLKELVDKAGQGSPSSAGR